MLIIALMVLAGIYTFRRMVYIAYNDLCIEYGDGIDVGAMVMALIFGAFLALFGLVLAPLFLLYEGSKHLSRRGYAIPRWVYMSVPAHERREIKERNLRKQVEDLRYEKIMQERRIDQLEREVLNA